MTGPGLPPPSFPRQIEGRKRTGTDCIFYRPDRQVVGCLWPVSARLPPPACRYGWTTMSPPGASLPVTGSCLLNIPQTTIYQAAGLPTGMNKKAKTLFDCWLLLPACHACPSLPGRVGGELPIALPACLPSFVSQTGQGRQDRWPGQEKFCATT